MSLTRAIIAWAGIGVIGGLVAPIAAGTYRKDRLARMCAFGAALAVACGLAAYLVNALFDDTGPDGASYGGGSGVLAVIVLVSLYLYEKRRSDSVRLGLRRDVFGAMYLLGPRERDCLEPWKLTGAISTTA